MAELQYHDDARDILNKFHRVDVMLYVEGQDDVPFWEFIIHKFSSLSVLVEEVGGKPELYKYAKKVIDGNLSCIIAMDADFSLFKEEFEHPNIMRTFGYSIENSLITPLLIREVIRAIGRVPRRAVSTEECEKWLKDFGTKIEPLVVYDIQNYLNNHGLLVLKDSCNRFIKNKSQPTLCENLISEFLDNLEITVEQVHFDEVSVKVKKESRSFLDIVRGHFLFSAVMTFIVWMIKKFRGKASISKESLYGSLILAFEKLFDDKHPHYKYYEAQVSGIALH